MTTNHKLRQSGFLGGIICMLASLLLASGNTLALVPLTGIVKITAGYTHNCALTSDGGIKCWGGNTRGGLGDDSTTTRVTPVDVLAGPGLPALSGVIAIGAGADHTCALTSVGWGQVLGIERIRPVR